MNRIIILLLAVSLIACEKDIAENAIPTDRNYSQVKTMTELDIPSNFDWGISKTFDVKLNSSSSQMVALIDQDGNVIQKLWVNGGQEISTTVTLPTFQSNMSVLSSTGSEFVSLNTNTINIQL